MNGGKWRRQRCRAELAAPLGNRGLLLWNLLKSLRGHSSEFSAQGMKWVSIHPPAPVSWWSVWSLTDCLHLQAVPGECPGHPEGIHNSFREALGQTLSLRCSRSCGHACTELALPPSAEKGVRLRGFGLRHKGCPLHLSYLSQTL